jgi:hypothetical protein
MTGGAASPRTVHDLGWPADDGVPSPGLGWPGTAGETTPPTTREAEDDA